jgi:hypothetical protein
LGQSLAAGLVHTIIVTRSTLAIAGGKSQQFTILNIDTIFNFYKPKPPLSKFVDIFWVVEGPAAERKIERILPTGTLELTINLRENKLGFYDVERRENCSHPYDDIMWIRRPA